MRTRSIVIALMVCASLLLIGTVAGAAEKAPKAAKNSPVIQTPKAPAAIGPYSQGIKAGGMVFVSGQLPINPADGKIPEGAAAQAKQSMENVKAVLEAGGSSLDKVVMVNIFVKDLNQFKAINDVYATFFKKNFPARATVEVARLPRDVQVEISAIAVK